MLAHGDGEIGMLRVVFLGSAGFSLRRKALRARIRDARKSKEYLVHFVRDRGGRRRKNVVVIAGKNLRLCCDFAVAQAEAYATETHA
jgi:hypothetical protein